MITCWPGARIPGHTEGLGQLGEREEDNLDKPRVQDRDGGGRRAVRGEGHAAHTGTNMDPATKEK